MKNKTKWILAGLTALLATSILAETDPSGRDGFTVEPLRDPFWPVGYLPDGWHTGLQAQDAINGSDWDTPATLIRISGTSRMGDQNVVIINGEIKEVGDLIMVKYNGRTYKWKLKGVKSNGKVSLERAGISNSEIGFQSGDKK